jgi:hypothetical protein
MSTLRAARPRTCNVRRRERPQGCCITPSTPPKRPDMAIYSQEEIFTLGTSPSWDSPDILTNEWSPWRLLPETSVKVRNLSADASAVNALVHLYHSPFGIGTERTLIATRMITLPPSQEVSLLYPLSPTVLAGDQRIAVHVRIEHPSDTRLINNHGAQIVFGATTLEVGRAPEFRFIVRNPLATQQEISLGMLANDLSAVVSPTVRMFAPFEQVQAAIRLSVPSTMHGTPAAEVRREATVVARGAGGAAIDGLTYVIAVQD